MSIRPLAFANKCLEAEHGEVGWSVVKLHVDIRCRRANGLSVAIFLAIFTAQTVASSELKVGKGENVLGGRNEKLRNDGYISLPLHFYVSFTTFLLLSACVLCPTLSL